MNRFIILLIFITLGMTVNAQTFQVKVVKISYGDTFTVINRDNLQIKFRVYGIDATEKKQAYGTKSREYLSSLIFGKVVTIDVQSIQNSEHYHPSVSKRSKKTSGSPPFRSIRTHSFKVFH